MQVSLSYTTHKIVDRLSVMFVRGDMLTTAFSLCLDSCLNIDAQMQSMQMLPHKAMKSESTLCIQALCSAHIHKITVTSDECLP